MRILVICGSRRENSRTRKLTDIAYGYAKEKYTEVEYIDLGKKDVEPFRGYIRDVKYSQETLEIVKTVESADIYIIGSPAYDGTMSSAVKNLFEYVGQKAIEGKVAGIMVKGASQGSWQQVRSHIVAMLNFFNVISNPRAVFASETDYDEHGELKNPEIKGRVERLVDETVMLKGGN